MQYSFFGKNYFYSFVDNCSTQFGKRELKRWIMHPLMNIQKINDRLDAVEDLIKFNKERNKMSNKLKQIPDIEKLLTKLFSYSVK